MASLFLAPLRGVDPTHDDYPMQRLEESAKRDAHGQHSLMKSPDDADIILFATNARALPVGLGLYHEELYRKHAERCILFDSGDRPSPLMGGLCASWPQAIRNDAAPAVGWCYHHPTSAEPFIDASDERNTPKYLWSFLGSSSTHPLRKKIFTLQDNLSYTRDTSKQSLPNLRGETDPDVQEKFRTDYIDLLYDSKFILCPRGVGASSMRIFEAMRAGRVPVIISDQWTPPPFVHWDKFAVRIKEKAISDIPKMLRAHEPQAQRMGTIAQQEWNRVFGDTGLFHYTVEACQMLLQMRENRTRSAKFKTLKYLSQAPYRLEVLRFLKNKMLHAQ